MREFREIRRILRELCGKNFERVKLALPHIAEVNRHIPIALFFVKQQCRRSRIGLWFRAFPRKGYRSFSSEISPWLVVYRIGVSGCDNLEVEATLAPGSTPCPSDRASFGCQRGFLRAIMAAWVLIAPTQA